MSISKVESMEEIGKIFY